MQNDNNGVKQTQLGIGERLHQCPNSGSKGRRMATWLHWWHVEYQRMTMS